jgi:hypothetical protein
MAGESIIFQIWINELYLVDLIFLDKFLQPLKLLANDLAILRANLHKLVGTSYWLMDWLPKLAATSHS